MTLNRRAFIATSAAAASLSAPMLRAESKPRVVVIGGGMTAVDAAVQSKLLGSETVTIAYRRGRDAMGASRFEQDLAATKGVRLLFNVQPVAVHGNGACAEIELEYTTSEGGQLTGTGETVRVAADQIYKAIGQTLEDPPDALTLEGRKIKVDAQGRTADPATGAAGGGAADP